MWPPHDFPLGNTLRSRHDIAANKQQIRLNVQKMTVVGVNLCLRYIQGRVSLCLYILVRGKQVSKSNRLHFFQESKPRRENRKNFGQSRCLRENLVKLGHKHDIN